MGKPLSLIVEFNGNKAKLSVLEDSGSRLFEPISGEPIIFLSESVLSKVVDKSTLSALKMGNSFFNSAKKEKYRVVIYNTVSGKDMCVCIKPKRLILENNTVSAWVAIGKNLNSDGIDGIVPSLLVNKGR